MSSILEYQVPFVVTLGGVTTGATALIVTLIRWWFAEKHRLGALVPYALSFCYGMLVILSAGGLAGGTGLLALWGANGLGSLALVWGVGTNTAAATRNLTRAHQLILDPGGHVIVWLLTVVLVSLWLWAPKIRNWKLATGALTGICFGLSGTLAGLAAVPLATGANLCGLPFTEML
jgi:hypothetical protein